MHKASSVASAIERGEKEQITMRYFVLFIVGLATIGGCATNGAMTAAPTEIAEAQQVAAADGDQAVCKRVIQKGSSYIERVCMPQSEWDKLLGTGTQQVAEADDADRIVCKRTTVGVSRFQKLVCMTSAQWKALQDDSQEQIRRIQRSHTRVQ